MRATYIIDDKGVLRHMQIQDLPVGRNADEVLRLVEAFKYTDEYGEVKGMLLKVKGRKWSKYVLIMLNFLDWYEVHLVNEKFELVEEVGNEICFTDLVEIIDNRIES